MLGPGVPDLPDAPGAEEPFFDSANGDEPTERQAVATPF